MERISQSSENSQEKPQSLGKERLDRLLDIVKKGARRPFEEVLTLDEKLGNLQTRISTSFEKSRSESNAERRVRRENATGWRQRFIGRKILEGRDLIANITNYSEFKSEEQKIIQEGEARKAELISITDSTTSKRLEKLRTLLRSGRRANAASIDSLDSEAGYSIASGPQETEIRPVPTSQPEERGARLESGSVGSVASEDQSRSPQEVLYEQSTKRNSPTESLQSILQRRETEQEVEKTNVVESPSSLEKSVSEKEYTDIMLEYMGQVSSHRNEVVQRIDAAHAERDGRKRKRDALHTSKRGMQAAMAA